MAGTSIGVNVAGSYKLQAGDLAYQSDQVIVPSEFISANGLNLPMIQMNNNQQTQNTSERPHMNQ